MHPDTGKITNLMWRQVVLEKDLYGGSACSTAHVHNFMVSER